MKQLCSLTLFLAILIFPVYAVAAEAIGTIVEIEGTVKKGKGSLFKPVDIDDPVYMKDIIRTDRGAKALVMFVDDTQITLGEDSELKIDEYVFDPDSSSPPSGKFSVAKGAFLFVSGLISKTDEPDVKIETAYGSIGIRGTTLWGGLLDGKYGVYVQSGKVNVSNESGEIDLGVGQGTSIQSRKHSPRALGQWDGGMINRAIRKTRLKNQAQVRERIAAMKEMHQAKREGRIEDVRKMQKERIEERKQEIKSKTKDRAQERIQNKKQKIKQMRLNR